MKRVKSILIMFIVICAVAAPCGSVFAFDAEKNHPGLTNEIIERYISLYGNTLSNGVNFDTVMSGEVVTESGERKALSLTVRDWIIVGSAEEDWGGIRAEAHYYDPQKSSGRSDFSSGAIAWIHSTSQSTNYVSATGQTYASGDYTYETFRSLYWGSPNDYRTYKTLGHLLHVLEDMGAPPHVRGLKEEDRIPFENRLKKYGSTMLSDMLSGTSSSHSGYLSQNRSSLGISSITAGVVPSYDNPDSYLSGLAEYANRNYFTQTTLYGSIYNLPSALTVPPAYPPYVLGDFSDSDGTKTPGYSSDGIFVVSRSLMQNKSTGWNGVVHLTPANHISYYQKLAPYIVRYGLGFINTATKANTLPSLSITASEGSAGNIKFTYTVTDAEYDYCTLQASYSIDGGTTYHTATPGPGGDGIKVSSSPTGTEHSFYWNSSADIAVTADVFFALIPRDLQTGTGDTHELTVGAGSGSAPVVSVTSPATTQYGYITISYTLIDDDFSVCSLSVYYSDDGGVTYNAATAGSGGDGVSSLNSAPGGVAHTYVWDSIADLGFTQQNDIRIRIVASDAVAGNGPASDTANFTVDNITARVSVQTPSAAESGYITISYYIFDGTSTLKDVTVEFSENGGTSYSSATAGVGGDGLVNLTSAPLPSGVLHTFVWDSVTDIGFANQSDIRIKITPNAGLEGATGDFTVENVNPAITFVNPTASSVQHAPMPITFGFKGPSVPDTVDFTVEYSFVSGVGPFVACTQAQLGYDCTGVTPSSTERQYTFWWDSETDLADKNYLDTSVWVRVSLPAGYFGGLSTTSGQFTLSHRGKADSAWPKVFGPEYANTGRTPFAGPDYSGAVSATKWVCADLYTQHSSPVIGPDGTIYVQGYNASYGFGLFAVHPVTGAIKWFFQNTQVADWRYNTPAVGRNDTVYVVLSSATADYEYLYAVNTSNGSAKWSSAYMVGRTYTLNGVVIDTDGTIFVNGYPSGQNTQCFAVVDNGQGTAPTLKWAAYNMGSAMLPYCVPIIDETRNNVIFSMEYNNKLVGLNRNTGALVWYENLGNDGTWNFRGGMMLLANQVYIKCTQVYAAYNATQSGGADIGGASWSIATANNLNFGNLGAGWDDTVYYINDSNLYAINGTTHAAKWNLALRGNCDSSPVVDKNGIIYVIGGTYIQAIKDNSASASEVWYYNNGYDYGANNRRETLALGGDLALYISAPNATRSLRAIGTWTPAPQELTPSSLPKTLGGKIKIYGGNFVNASGNATAVKLKAGSTEISLSFTVQDYSTIIATVPAGLTAGVYDVYVTAPGVGGTNTVSYVQLTIVDY